MNHGVQSRDIEKAALCPPWLRSKIERASTSVWVTGILLLNVSGSDVTLSAKTERKRGEHSLKTFKDSLKGVGLHGHRDPFPTPRFYGFI